MDERSVLGKLRGYCVGASYAFLWYGSILLGFFFLYAPVFPLIFINAKLFRKLTDTFYSSWEAFNVVSELNSKVFSSVEPSTSQTKTKMLEIYIS